MPLDNIRVSRKLWGMFLVLMVTMLVISGFQQYRANSSMAQAIEEVISIEGRVTEAVRWRGSTETAVNMLMGAAVTTDAVLAQQFDAKVKEIIGAVRSRDHPIAMQLQQHGIGVDDIDLIVDDQEQGQCRLLWG